MKTPRNLDGVDFVAALVRHWDYRFVHQVGSHMIVETQTPFPHRLSVPAHTPVRVGTLNGMIRDVSEHKRVSKEDILKSL
jgi:predicted RNA binding protein YcfA (HicA-like mRNA interferase family)